MIKKTSYLAGILLILISYSCSSPTPNPTKIVDWEAIRSECIQASHSTDIKASIDAYEKAYTLFQNLPDSSFTKYPFLDSLFFPLANQWKSIGESVKARALFEEALTTLAFTANDSAALYNQLGLTYKIESKLIEATANYQKGLAIKNSSPAIKGYLLSNYIIAALAIGKTDSLVTFCDQAINLLKENTIATKNALANVYKTKGQLYFTRGQLALAGQNFDNGLTYATGRAKSKIIVDKGKLLNTIGQHDESIAAFNYSMQLLIPSFQPTSITQNPADKELYPENSLIEALEGKVETFYGYYEATKDIKWLDALLATYEKIYKVERMMWQLYQYDASKQNLQHEIRKKLEKALAITYQLVRGYYNKDRAKSKQYIHKAFKLAEQTKSMTLLGVVRQSKAVQFGLPATQVQKEKALRALIKHNEAIPDNPTHQLKQQYAQFIRQLERDYPAYFQLKYDDQTISIPIIQKELLAPNQALIEYVSTTDALYSFIIRKDTALLYRFQGVGSESLTTLTHSMIRNGILMYQDSIKKSVRLASPAKATYLAAANQLYKYLLPWQPDFKDIDKLTIIPDGVLGYLPFDALLTNKKDTTFKALPYLIRQYEINYSYSATLLQEMSAYKNHPTNIFMGLAPEFQQEIIPQTKTRLAPLTLNKTEIRQLKKTIGRGYLLEEEAASKTNFQKNAESYQIIHFSTHGFANDQRGEDSWIALTPNSSNSQNGLLLTRELYNYQLNADFVSLSACETALGELVTAEGIIGMTRAFSYAGAKSMMTTLWRVDEQNTMDITANFYTYLKGNATSPLSKSKALQKAKLDFINRDFNPHPFKWAGHILIGDDSSLF